LWRLFQSIEHPTICRHSKIYRFQFSFQILPDGDMEHSYSRDNSRPEGNPQMGGTRTIMVHRPPQCPSCHIHTEEGIDIDEPYNPPLPKYDEENAKIAMEDTNKVAKYLKNTNSEELDWEEKFKNQ
jgi:regulatory NSL complex subunit 3